MVAVGQAAPVEVTAVNQVAVLLIQEQEAMYRLHAHINTLVKVLGDTRKLKVQQAVITT